MRLTSDPSRDQSGRTPGHRDEVAAPDLDALAAQAKAARGDVGNAVLLAETWGERLPRPGGGSTAELWGALATLGAVDLTVARVVEPHLDALAILSENRSEQASRGRGPGAEPPEGAVYGVYAAEGPDGRLGATVVERTGGWRVDGVKPWCSLAESVSHALVTAWVGSDRRLFLVDLSDDGIIHEGGSWVARGLSRVRSTSVWFDNVAAIPIGAEQWYLTRPGFAWGGIGVAAVWFGAATAIARRLRDQAEERPLDQVGQWHLGTVDTALYAARAVLCEAAAAVDDGGVAGAESAVLALRVRNVVAAAAEEVSRRADHAMGPAPLVSDEDHAQRVADLHLYLRQHHAERDVATLGRLLAP